MLLGLGGETFCSGRARFSDHPQPGNASTARIFVKIRAAGIPGVMLAELDTGSPYSILNPEVAESAGIEVGTGEAYSLMTANGRREGRLVRHELVLLADEGESLRLETTIFVPTESIANHPFLGYCGFLEAIRIGLDPQHNDFYFGPADRQ